MTVYAYLVQPAIEAWGMNWLERGSANIILEKPLYDGRGFSVDVVTGDAPSYEGKVLDEDGMACARGSVGLASEPAPAVELCGRPRAPAPELRPRASRAALEELGENGLGALQAEWSGRGDYDRYTRDLDAMPELLRPDGQAFANPAFLLGLANAVLTHNLCLGPWIHVQSEVRNHAAVASGSSLLVEAGITDLQTRAGHEFVDLEVAVFIEPDSLAMTASHRAIYKLREG
ncbi:MAG: hypothetical protein ACE5D3_01295 [Candidatus Binatia bacterium]